MIKKFCLKTIVQDIINAEKEVDYFFLFWMVTKGTRRTKEILNLCSLLLFLVDTGYVFLETKYVQIFILSSFDSVSQPFNILVASLAIID